MSEQTNVEACKRFGVDSKRVASIARRLSKAAREAESLGLNGDTVGGLALLAQALD